MPPTLEEDDAIIVTKTCPRPESPDIKPIVATLLARLNPQGRRLESPGPELSAGLDLHVDRSARPRRTNSQLHNAPRAPKANIPTMEERLQQMPILRALPFRDGVEEGAENETGGDSRRKQIRFGCLLATRGVVQTPGCISCENGRGKFRLCVALEGYFKGACASCQLSGRPNRCSIKKEDDDAMTKPSAHTPSGSVNDVQQSALTPGSDPPKRKRRRTSEVKRANEAKRQSVSRPSSYVPQPQPQPKPQLPQPPQWDKSAAPQLAPQNITEAQQRPWATVNAPLPTPSHQRNGSNGSRPKQPQYTPSAPVGWATVNQPQAYQPPHPYYQAQERSLSQHQPRPPTLGQAQHAMQSPGQRPILNGGESNGSISWRSTDQERRESTVDESSGNLIDNLPKNKQRQVYGLISGLQGGIQHLQRELESLKSALGINDEG